MIDIRMSSGGNAIHASTTALQAEVDPAAPVRGEDPEHGREDAAEEHGAEAHVQRDPGAVEDAREDVAAELIGAEPVLRHSRR